MSGPGRPIRQVIGLGVTQTVAWASSTYLPAILAEPIARDLGTSRSTVFGAFSVALIVMAIAGPHVGRAIDRQGGRGLLALSNLVLAAGLVLLQRASFRSRCLCLALLLRGRIHGWSCATGPTIPSRAPDQTI